MAIQLSPVSAQVELTPAGVFNLTVMRLAPTGGTLESITGYNMRIASPTDAVEFSFAVPVGVSQIKQSFAWDALVTLFDTAPSFTPETFGLTFNIQAYTTDTAFLDSPWWPQNRLFPPIFSVGVSKASPQVGDDVVYLLPVAYGDNVTRIRFSPTVSDPTSIEPWRSFVPGMEFSHIFQEVGTFTSQIQVSSDVQSATNGSSFLMRDGVISVTVSSAPQYPLAGFNSWLGVGSALGFTFTDATTSNYAPGNFSVILTGSAVSSRNKELKMFLAASRSSDANTYYQTIAWDLYPVPGRYRIPSFAPVANISFDATRSYTDASLYAPLKLTGLQLPNFQVGYHYDIELETLGGLKPYAYYALDLPDGLTCTSQGRIIGSPTKSGLFQSTLSVVDSENPPQVDVKTLGIFVETDLAITDVPFQYYYIDEPASTQIYAVGGVPPYTWQVNSGQDTLTSMNLLLVTSGTFVSIEGTPQDQGLLRLPNTFSVSLQVQDAVGAIATTTFECGVYPPKLHIAKYRLDEFFEREYCEQRIIATGGDNLHYNWAFEILYSSTPAQPDGTWVFPPQISYAPTVGATNVLRLIYNSDNEPTNPSGDPVYQEAYYRVRCTVTSGSAGAIETDSHCFDLIISPALADLVIVNDAQLPVAVRGDSTWAVDLQVQPPQGADYDVSIDDSTPGKSKQHFDINNIAFSYAFPKASDGITPLLQLNPVSLPTGQVWRLSLNPLVVATLPYNLNTWFRITITSGRTSYFKDFHFMTSNDALGFSIHVLDSFPSATGSNYVAIAQQFNSLSLHTNDAAVAFLLWNVTEKRWVNDVGVFSYTGTLPPGVSFSSLGFLYGTPTTVQEGGYTFGIVATIGTTSVSYTATIYVNQAYAYTTDLLHDVQVALDELLGVIVTDPKSSGPISFVAWDPLLPYLSGWVPTAVVTAKHTATPGIYEGDSPTINNYGTIITANSLIDDPDRPTSGDPDYNAPVESWTYAWNLSNLPTANKLGQPINAGVSGLVSQANPDITLVNNTRQLFATGFSYTYSLDLMVTDMGGSGYSSVSPSVPLTVHTPWFSTASPAYEAWWSANLITVPPSNILLALPQDSWLNDGPPDPATDRIDILGS